jgi:glucose-6-phosphate isomerase
MIDRATGLTATLPEGAAAIVGRALDRARDEHWAERLFDRDATLWTGDADVAAAIVDRLGWLDAPDHFTAQIAALEGFGDAIREAGFRTAVVMGMGGSSLAPDVLHRTFGTTEGYLDLRILDSTDPAAVAAAVDDLDPLSTLWIVASKSGTTTEPLAFQADAWARIDAALEAGGSGQAPGEFMVAITDPGASVEAIPHSDGFREVFLNPPNVGGRYSALTYVGLVPASLIGLDLDALLASADAMLGRCREPEPTDNPGVALGILLGTLAREGRDKVTFLADAELAAFGAWAEQLIAESTGKAGTGIVPVDLEPLGAPGDYGDDRLFVRLALDGGTGSELDAAAARLAAAGHPLVTVRLEDPIDLAAEFVRWEVATAVAGIILEIDPFDQPNVEEAKALTRRLLARAGHEHAAEPSDAAHSIGVGDPGLVRRLREHLGGRRDGAYVAVQAFIAPSVGRDAAIAGLRRTVMSATRCATTAGYGPRFLHSTGQLHKGGTPNGCFIQLTADHPADRAIPGWPYSFGRLIDAQAQGDLGAIAAHDLPILRVHLGADPDAGLATLAAAVESAVR